MSGGAKCAACKRRLKRPSESGLGPVCERRLHGPPARRPRPATPTTAELISGQTELLLPGIDWSDIDDDPDDEWPEPEPRHRDLDGQGLTALQLHSMTTIRPTGGYV